MGAGGSIWKRPVRIPFFSLMVGNEFLWILCFVTTNFMTPLKKLCIHQNHIQKDIGFLNKTKMQNINGELRTAFFEWLLYLLSTKFFSLITTNIGSKQQKVQRKRIINFTPHNFGTTQKNERASSKCEKILHDQCKMVGGKTMWSCHESNGRSTYFFNAILHLCPLGIHRTMGSMRK